MSPPRRALIDEAGVALHETRARQIFSHASPASMTTPTQTAVSRPRASRYRSAALGSTASAAAPAQAARPQARRGAGRARLGRARRRVRPMMPRAPAARDTTSQ